MGEPPRTGLTRAEFEALPHGAPIRVVWAGGNGPFDYIVREGWCGNRSIGTNIYVGEYEETRSVHRIASTDDGTKKDGG